jgi:hypothetical protein
MRLILLAIVVVAGSAACARVRPHQREHLAHPAMQAVPWRAVDRGDQHVFSIREGTEGATAEGGGGCGCN